MELSWCVFICVWGGGLWDTLPTSTFDTVYCVWYRTPDTTVRLYATRLSPAFILIDGNARPHKDEVVEDYLEG